MILIWECKKPRLPHTVWKVPAICLVLGHLKFNWLTFDRKSFSKHVGILRDVIIKQEYIDSTGKNLDLLKMDAKSTGGREKVEMGNQILREGMKKV